MNHIPKMLRFRVMQLFCFPVPLHKGSLASSLRFASLRSQLSAFRNIKSALILINFLQFFSTLLYSERRSRGRSFRIILEQNFERAKRTQSMIDLLRYDAFRQIYLSHHQVILNKLCTDNTKQEINKNNMKQICTNYLIRNVARNKKTH